MKHGWIIQHKYGKRWLPYWDSLNSVIVYKKREDASSDALKLRLGTAELRLCKIEIVEVE